jgi:hypothetical protein
VSFDHAQRVAEIVKREREAEMARYRDLAKRVRERLERFEQVGEMTEVQGSRELMDELRKED